MNTRGYVTTSEARAALRAIYRVDPEIDPMIAFMRMFQDDLTPIDTKGRWRPSRLVVLVGAILCVVMAVFVYFSFGVSR
jgi:hypothetical protein